MRLRDDGGLVCSLSLPEQEEVHWFAVVARLGQRLGQREGDVAAEGEHLPTFHGPIRGLDRQDRGEERRCGVSRVSIWKTCREGECFCVPVSSVLSDISF